MTAARCPHCGASYSQSDLQELVACSGGVRTRSVACVICGRSLVGNVYPSHGHRADLTDEVILESSFQRFSEAGAESIGWAKAQESGWVTEGCVNVSADLSTGRLCSFKEKEYCRYIAEAITHLGHDWRTVADRDVMKVCRHTQAKHAGYCFYIAEDIQICGVCRGSGKSVCSTCSGKGYLQEECELCQGQKAYPCTCIQGRAECPECGGHGRIPCFFGLLHVRCRRCGGDGRVTHESCRGTGRVSCTGCSGTGFVPCSACSTEGLFICTSCLGRGRL